MKLIEPGHYVGKIVDYGIPETQKEYPQVAVTFEIETTEGVRRITWFGSLHPNAQKYTIDQLLYCGLQGNSLASMADGVQSGALNLDLELDLKVEHNTYNDKTTHRVSFINPLGGRGFKKMSEAMAKTKLTGLDGLVASRRTETGITDETFRKAQDVPF